MEDTRERETSTTGPVGTTSGKGARSARPKAAPELPASGYGFLFEANQQAFARWINGITALSGEVTQFIQKRLQDDMAGWSALASCRTPEDAFECQRRLAEKATAHYAEEVTRLSQLMMRLATESLDSLHSRADRGSSSTTGKT